MLFEALQSSKNIVITGGHSNSTYISSTKHMIYNFKNCYTNGETVVNELVVRVTVKTATVSAAAMRNV